MKPAMIVSTYPDRRSLARVADQLVRSRVAACVNISRTSSVYLWKGKVESSPEYVGLFKTTQENKDALKEKIRETHPYDVPEIAEIDVASVNRPYLDWLVESTS